MPDPRRRGRGARPEAAGEPPPPIGALRIATTHVIARYGATASTLAADLAARLMVAQPAEGAAAAEALLQMGRHARDALPQIGMALEGQRLLVTWTLLRTLIAMRFDTDHDTDLHFLRPRVATLAKKGPASFATPRRSCST